VGYDVSLRRRGRHLIIQFELSRFVEAGAGKTKEERDGRVGPPLYRMYFRPAMKSNQHAKLQALQHALKGGVYCYAPPFHTIAAIQKHWDTGEIELFSRRVRPCDISLPNDLKEHWLTFYAPRGGATYRFSDEDDERASDLNINPGGGVMHRPLNWRHMRCIPVDLRNRLLSKEEVDTPLDVLGD
jgi:hypothetical protein